MNGSAQQFPYLSRYPVLGAVGLAPLLPIVLLGPNRATTLGLADTGASLNVLPFAVGVGLGLDWDQQSVVVQLTGILAGSMREGFFCSARWERSLPFGWRSPG